MAGCLADFPALGECAPIRDNENLAIELLSPFLVDRLIAGCGCALSILGELLKGLSSIPALVLRVGVGRRFARRWSELVVPRSARQDQEMRRINAPTQGISVIQNHQPE